MGYRSDVAYTIRFDDSDKGRQTFEIFLADARQNEATKGIFRDSEGDEPILKIDYAKRQINFRAHSVKWYPDYEDVKCHDALFALAKEYVEDLIQDEVEVGCCMGAIFTIIGENMDDIQEDSCGDYDWDWVSVSRQIVTDWE
jgi:hypothetical protein